MSVRSAGEFEGTYWTIQHKRVCDGKCYGNADLEKYWHDWAFSNFDNIAAPAQRLENAWQTFSHKGFLTKELGMRALAEVRARSENASDHLFRLVEVYTKEIVTPVVENKRR